MMTFCNVIRMVVFWPKSLIYFHCLPSVLFRYTKSSRALLLMNVVMPEIKSSHVDVCFDKPLL